MKNDNNSLRQFIDSELKNLDKKIYDFEQLYLEETNSYGNILKGWDTYIYMKKTKNNNYNNQKKNSRISDKSRIFSLTSCTSQTSRNLKKEHKKLYSTNDKRRENKIKNGKVFKKKKKSIDNNDEDYDYDNDYDIKQKRKKSKSLKDHSRKSNRNKAKIKKRKK